MSADTTPNEQEGVELLLAAYKRWENMPPLVFAMDRPDAYMLICGIQLLMRHPGIEGPGREVLETVGRGMQERVCDSAELYAMLELGWNPAHDVRQADADGGQ